MAIDLNKMKSKLSSLQSKGGNNSFWKPQDGTQTIRILPTEDGDPFKSYFFHYNVGQNSGFLCPNKNHGEDCAVCNFAKSLYKEGDEGSIKMAKDLTARQRFFSPVLVRGEEAEGPKVWGYGKKVYETLLTLVLNPEYGDITDPNSGTDLDLQYGKPAGASFPQTSLTPKRKTSTMCIDLTSEECDQVLSKVPDFDKLFEAKSSDEVATLLREHLSSDGSAEESSSETRVSGEQQKKTSVDAAFDDLLSA
mgnify:FL=1